MLAARLAARLGALGAIGGLPALRVPALRGAVLQGATPRTLQGATARRRTALRTIILTSSGCQPAWPAIAERCMRSGFCFSLPALGL